MLKSEHAGSLIQSAAQGIRTRSSMMGSALYPYLYFPIEISARELDSRLLLTAIAVDRGFKVVLGQKWLLHDNLPYMQPGVLLTKTLTPRDAHYMEIARRHGYRTANIDEEIPGLVATRQGLRWVMRAAVDATDVIFAAGNDHLRALMEKFPDRTDRFRIVGNPRWDLLRPELRTVWAEDVAQLHRRYGRFLLINTNFGLTNSAKGDSHAVIRSLVRDGRIDLKNPDDRAYIDTGWQLELANVACIKEVLRELPKHFPNHRFVLRPHPGEALDPWREFARDIPQTLVVRDGAAMLWIMAAEALIHTNCTTGIEAFALGTPAICLRPANAPEVEIYVAGRVNPIARSVADVIEQLSRIVSGAAFPAEMQRSWRREFDDFIAAREGPLAAERVVDSIASEFFHAPNVGEKIPDDCWRPRQGFRGAIRRSRSRMSLMPEVDAASLGHRLKDLANRLGICRNFTVETCGDRMFYVHAGALPPRQIPIPPTIVAFIHRLAQKGRHLQLW